MNEEEIIKVIVKHAGRANIHNVYTLSGKIYMAIEHAIRPFYKEITQAEKNKLQKFLDAIPDNVLIPFEIKGTTRDTGKITFEGDKNLTDAIVKIISNYLKLEPHQLTRDPKLEPHQLTMGKGITKIYEYQKNEIINLMLDMGMTAYQIFDILFDLNLIDELADPHSIVKNAKKSK